MSKPQIISFIASLFGAGRPLAIVWTISLIIVFAINGMLVGRWHAHIRNESIEILPRWINSDATAAVIFIFGGAFSGASCDHSLPYVIDASFAHVVGSNSTAELVDIKTAATFSITLSQIWAFDDNAFPAIASTFPEAALFADAGCPKPSVGDDREPAKFSSSVVFYAAREFDRLVFSHDGLSPLRLEPDSGYSPYPARFIISNGGLI